MNLSVLGVLASCFWAVAAAGAQDGPEPPPAIPPASQPPVPHCDSYSLQTLPSMNFEQRTCIWSSKLLTPTAVFGSSFMSMLAQLRNDPSEWPQGAKGYGYRFGTRYAQGVVKSTATFLAGVASREDPRAVPPPGYDCPMQSNTVGMRLGRSIARVFVSYSASGDGSCHTRFAPARTVGAFASGFVQRAWLPDSQNTAGNALRGSATSLGLYLSDSVFAEFQGDLWGWLGKMFTTGKSNK